MTSSNSQLFSKLIVAIAILVLLAGVYMRWSHARATLLWIDEAESAINALTILDHGVPVSHYLSQPLYENTLTKPFPESEEYEFKDSSYSEKGFAVYHGWLPFYAIAGAQLLLGIAPDELDPVSGSPLHSVEDIFIRSLAPRIPSLLFAAFYLIVVFILVYQVSGPPAALTSLIWLSVGSKAVEFGHQARYYSLTLLMSAVCALAVWKLYKKGRTRDYVLLGIAEGLLFHTHHLSAVIFAATCLVLIPRILMHDRWFIKSLLAAGIAGSITIPWAWWSGFFGTATSVPMAFQLFESLSDWVRYFQDRILVFILLLLIGSALPVSRWAERKEWKHPSPYASNNLPAIFFLIVWMLVAVVAFHLLVPAASFFMSRLTLILFTPVGILLGIALSEFCPRKFGLQILAAALLPLTLLYLSNHLPKNPRSFIHEQNRMASMIAFLEEQELKQPFRIFAAATDHHIWKYYTGLPIQSIAPVRKSFLSEYPHTIVYLDNPWLVYYPSYEEVDKYASMAGRVLTNEEIAKYWTILVEDLMVKTLERRGIAVSEEHQHVIPDYFIELRQNLKLANEGMIREALDLWKTQIIFKSVDSSEFQDFWLSFFYRFVDYPSRIGEHSNVYPVLQKSDITFLPNAASIAFRYDPLSPQPPQESEPK